MVLVEEVSGAQVAASANGSVLSSVIFAFGEYAAFVQAVEAYNDSPPAFPSQDPADLAAFANQVSLHILRRPHACVNPALLRASLTSPYTRRHANPQTFVPAGGCASHHHPILPRHPHPYPTQGGARLQEAMAGTYRVVGHLNAAQHVSLPRPISLPVHTPVT